MTVCPLDIPFVLVKESVEVGAALGGLTAAVETQIKDSPTKIQQRLGASKPSTDHRGSPLGTSAHGGPRKLAAVITNDIDPSYQLVTPPGVVVSSQAKSNENLTKGCLTEGEVFKQVGVYRILGMDGNHSFVVLTGDSNIRLVIIVPIMDFVVRKTKKDFDLVSHTLLLMCANALL